MTAAPLLEIQDLSVAFPSARGTTHAVRDVSLSIARGEIVGLVGESGCGKSTLGYALMGDFGPGKIKTAGHIHFDNIDILQADGATLRSLRGTRIAMVHQNPGGALTPSLTIGSQLLEILTVHKGLSRHDAHSRIIEVLRQVNLPDPAALLDRYAHELSGGQQQRVVIAAALLGDPDLLILDEPTTGLDVTVEAVVLDLLRELRDKTGVAMLFIAHNLGVIARICERVGVMYAGELVEMAPVRELFRQPRHPYTISLLGCIPRVDQRQPRLGLQPIPGLLPSPFDMTPGCQFSPRCNFAAAACFNSRPELEQDGKCEIRCFRWREIDANLAPAANGSSLPAANDALAISSTSDRPEVLVTPGLSVSYRIHGSRGRGSFTAVDNVDLALRKGTITAIVGESGSGKTSLGRALVGLSSHSAGAVSLRGRDISGPVRTRPGFAHRLLQMVFQDHAGTLNPSLSVGRIIARPLRLFGIVPRRQEAEKVSELLGAVGLNPATAARASVELSGGQKQRVAIARAFAGQPDIVVCDEITSALDVSVQASVLNFLLSLQERSGTSLLFISHDLGVVRYIANEVMVMYLGRICERGPAEAVFAGPNHPYTAALMSAVPVPDPDDRREHIRLDGVVPSAANRPVGCPFHTRCPRKIGTICETVEPPLRQPRPGHQIECHHEIETLVAFSSQQAQSQQRATLGTSMS
jgi:peptide/nickel transport system ATP-binding protein